MASPRPGPPSSARKAKNTPRTVVSRANIPSLKLQAPPPIEQLPLLIAPSILSPRNTSPRAKTSNPFAFPQLQIPTPSEFGVLLASNPEEPLPQPLQDWLLAGVSLGITLAAGGAILSTKVPPVTQLLLLLSSVTPVTVETIQDSLKPQPPANKKTGFRPKTLRQYKSMEPIGQFPKSLPISKTSEEYTAKVEIHSRRAEYAAKIGKRGSIANATAQPAAGVHPPPSAAPTVVPHPHRPTAKSLSSVSIDCLDLSPPEETDRPNTRSPSQILGSDGFSPMLNTTQGNPKALRKTDMDRSGENLVALLATDGPMFVNNGSVTDVRGEGLGFDPQAVDVARVSPRGDTAQALTFKELAARSGVKQKRA